MRTSIAAGVVALVLLQASAAFAATYFVATNGNDSNPGTQAQPFRTIARGLSVTRAGDTLYLRGGTYNEAITSNRQTIPTGTSWNDAPRIASYPGESAVLQGSYGNGIDLAHSYIRYVIFDGLVVDGGGVSVQYGANHVRFQNGEIKNARGQGIQAGFGNTATTHLELINMSIHHNGDPVTGHNQGGRYDHGVYIAVQNALIEGCDIYENTGYGIHIYDSGGGNASNTIVRNNRIHHNRGDHGVILSYGSNIQFYNNVVYGNLNGVQVNYNVSNAQVYNNTIFNHQGSGVEVGSGASNTTIRNNIIYQQSVPIANYGSGTTTSNNLTSDPKFASVSNSDFRLLSTSSAIDAGNSVSIVNTDMTGMARPQGSAYDIGAYEYRSQTNPPAPPRNVRVVTP